MQLTITGIPGWLGHALESSLNEEPIPAVSDIRALVNRAVPIDTSLRSAYPAVTSWLPFDLDQAADFAGLFDGGGTVIHAAGVIHVKSPAEWDRINTAGTIALATAAKRAGVKRFVFVSSNAAGGACSSAIDVLTEDMPPRPLSRYGASKLAAERGLFALQEPGTFDIVVLRPSMFYGPPVPARHIEVYRRILHGSMPLIGSGDYRRSVTHIANLVQAVRLAAVRPEAAGQTYYVVDREIHTTRSIVDAMAEALGVRPRYIRLPAFTSTVAYGADRMLESMGRYVAPVHLVGEATWHVAISSAKAERELGYAPTGTLHDGMREAVAWCRSQGQL